MRLIDADKIPYIREFDWDDSRPSITDEYSVNAVPTVNAIPRRWIKVWGRRNNQKEIIKQLLDDWSEFKQKQ